jgi:hypothetical protein
MEAVQGEGRLRAGIAVVLPEVSEIGDSIARVPYIIYDTKTENHDETIAIYPFATDAGRLPSVSERLGLPQ